MRRSITPAILTLSALLAGPASGTINVALVGDSITRGQYWDTTTYPEYLEAMFTTAFGAGEYNIGRYENAPAGPGFGHSGATLRADGGLPYIEQLAYTQSLAFQPDIVVLMLGANDARIGTQQNINNGNWNWDNPALDGGQTSLERFLEDYQALIDVYDGLASQPDIVIMSPIPVSTGGQASSSIDAGVIENEIAPAVRNDVANFAAVDAFIDLNLLFPEDSTEFYPNDDIIHPSSAGYEFIAQQVFDLLTTDPLGDLNGDHYVGIADLDIVLANWGGTVDPGNRSLGDANGDGTVGQHDLQMILDTWGSAALGYDAPTEAIPEPASAALLLAGAGVLMRRRRRSF